MDDARRETGLPNLATNFIEKHQENRLLGLNSLVHEPFVNPGNYFHDEAVAFLRASHWKDFATLKFGEYGQETERQIQEDKAHLLETDAKSNIDFYRLYYDKDSQVEKRRISPGI